MSYYFSEISLKSYNGRVTYLNISDQIRAAVKESDIKNGMVLVQTPHTTCSIMFEEFVHDKDFNGDEFLQVDLNHILDQIVPRELTENRDYRYPGPKHVQFLKEIAKDHPEYPDDPSTILNGDAHIRASLFGCEKTFGLKDSELLIGTVGYIYFVDWDQNRSRDRKCFIIIMGE
ncbi:MAG: YjbQ family protein [Enterococcaceae bacterium]|jgi:thiamine phosphate synthase YjbQ (UPF0047 family)|nr:YjbQ family protein [Enterococcaceae bacterium]MCI1919299.1 YjbQ family protein [Enterococcaceae bacterium]